VLVSGLVRAPGSPGRPAKRAHLNNEYFIVEKDGIPVIGIMDADELEDYLDQAAAGLYRIRSGLR
jgi:hypothetical protein